jgi:hypothetical protein
VEKRLDDSLALRFGERYLSVKPCIASEKKKAPVVKQASQRRPAESKRNSTWSKNFDLKKAPKVWQAAEESGYRRS